MKKVFIIHGHKGYPNGAWRPWLMSELSKKGIYASTLPMPGFEEVVCNEWIDEINRCVKSNADDEIYLVGHSLGSTAILRYLENPKKKIAGAILVSTPIERPQKVNLDSFFETAFNFELIKSNCSKFGVIHGEDDTWVSVEQGKILAEKLNSSIEVIPLGGHLSGLDGSHTLPECLELLLKMVVG